MSDHRARVTGGQLRICQLNIGSLLEPDWDRRQSEIVSWIDHLQPDVVCLQEVWQSGRTPNSADQIVEALDTPMEWTFGGHGVQGTLSREPGAEFGSAILSRWPIDGQSVHRLPTYDDSDPIVNSVPWELLQVSTAGLDIFSTHLAPAPSHGLHRRMQVLAIDDIIGQARGTKDDHRGFGQRRTGMPPLLCGDFNAEPDSDEIRFLCGLTSFDDRTTFYQDAWRVAGTGEGLTQDWRDNYIAEGLNIPRKRIDYVFVGDPFLREGDAGRVLDAQLAFHEPRTGIVASDHRGLVVDVVWPDRPKG
ncbi:MAG: endonuclease/exonuclease/phosphatase family protein [Actinomycetia bacterium]|nr:endonuclease/exonuclease/phosphatase family protein [Actinomycetes bacterium]MCP4960765.1 endonuclease/exonuclease/phosphatase family protein [Actinomycetes bacterium]